MLIFGDPLHPTLKSKLKSKRKDGIGKVTVILMQISAQELWNKILTTGLGVGFQLAKVLPVSMTWNYVTKKNINLNITSKAMAKRKA